MRSACLFVLLTSALGCSRFERISQCRELAEAVNPRMAEIEALSKGKSTPEAYAKIAQSYAALADEVSALPVAQSAASAQVQEYVQNLRSAASSSREISTALGAGARTDAPRRDLDKLSRKDKMSAQRLDAYCLAP